MKFLSIIAVVAASTAVVAMPATETREELGKRGCHNSDPFCGDCNGSSCKIAGFNIGCQSGRCDGPNGGDGAYCWSEDMAPGSAKCP